jgi:hypothetical protein
MQTLPPPPLTSSRIAWLVPVREIGTQLCGLCGKVFVIAPPAAVLRDAGDDTFFYEHFECAAAAGYFSDFFAEGIG